MLPIPKDIFAKYEAVLNKREIAISRRAEYLKWLRYYLDFCAKYPVPDSQTQAKAYGYQDKCFIVFMN